MRVNANSMTAVNTPAPAGVIAEAILVQSPTRDRDAIDDADHPPVPEPSWWTAHVRAA